MRSQSVSCAGPDGRREDGPEVGQDDHRAEHQHCRDGADHGEQRDLDPRLPERQAAIDAIRPIEGGADRLGARGRRQIVAIMPIASSALLRWPSTSSTAGASASATTGKHIP